MLPLKLVRILILSIHENLLPRLVLTKTLMHVNGTSILIILIRIYIGFKIQIRILRVKSRRNVVSLKKFKVCFNQFFS
jgi:hypothetical protein